MFRKDAEERLQKLRFFLYEGLSAGKGMFPEKHLSSLGTQIQALKGASAAIGAAEVSDGAARLDAAVRNRDLVFLYDSLPGFIEKLAELVKNIRAAIESKPDENAAKPAGGGFFRRIFAGRKPDNAAAPKTGPSEYLPVFNRLKDAINSQNLYDIDHVLAELSLKPLDAKTREILENISDEVLMTEFDSAIKTIDKLIAGEK